jgi:hypothetical protein
MKTKQKSEYDLQAEKFVKDTNIEIVKTYTGHRFYFDGDKERRACFHITVKRGNQSFSYDFGQSIMESYLVETEFGFTHRKPRPINQSDLRLKAVNQLLRGEKSCDSRIRLYENKVPPSDYSLLSCMSMDSYQSDSFEDWCDNFGYDTDSRKALDTFLKCQKISSDINRFFTDTELEQLQEIN